MWLVPIKVEPSPGANQMKGTCGDVGQREVPALEGVLCISPSLHSHN